MRSEQEIEKVIRYLIDNKQKVDRRFFGMSYAGGVDEALRWVLEEEDSLAVHECMDEWELYREK